MSSGDMSQVRIGDVGWLWPARQSGDGWGAQVKAMQLSTNPFLGGAVVWWQVQQGQAVADGFCLSTPQPRKKVLGG